MPADTKTSKRGGKRPGAGRKPIGDRPMSQAAIRLPADLLARVDAAAARADIPRNEVVRRALEKYFQSL